MFSGFLLFTGHRVGRGWTPLDEDGMTYQPTYQPNLFLLF